MYFFPLKFSIFFLSFQYNFVKCWFFLTYFQYFLQIVNVFLHICNCFHIFNFFPNLQSLFFIFQSVFSFTWSGSWFDPIHQTHRSNWNRIIAVFVACDGPAHLQEQVSGRRRHEDSVAPRGASGVHVLLPLIAVFTVRITETTAAEWSARR